MLHLPFPDSAFDGVCSYYAIVHVPRVRHALILRELRRVLRPGGWALICLGAKDVPAWQDVALLGRPILFSHYDVNENLEMLAEQGLAIRWSYIVGADTAAAFLFALVQAEEDPA